MVPLIDKLMRFGCAVGPEGRFYVLKRKMLKIKGYRGINLVG
jgi:hypothetical protein